MTHTLKLSRTSHKSLRRGVTQKAGSATAEKGDALVQSGGSKTALPMIMEKKPIDEMKAMSKFGQMWNQNGAIVWQPAGANYTNPVPSPPFCTAGVQGSPIPIDNTLSPPQRTVCGPYPTPTNTAPPWTGQVAFSPLMLGGTVWAPSGLGATGSVNGPGPMTTMSVVSKGVAIHPSAGVSARYIRVRAANDTGLASMSQLVVYGVDGANLSQGKVGTAPNGSFKDATMTSAAPSTVTDGTLVARAWPVWTSATAGANQYYELDLGSVQNIGSITYYGRTDCCNAITGAPDRITGTRIQLLATNTATATPIKTLSLQSGDLQQTMYPGLPYSAPPLIFPTVRDTWQWVGGVSVLLKTTAPVGQIVHAKSIQILPGPTGRLSLSQVTVFDKYGNNISKDLLPTASGAGTSGSFQAAALAAYNLTDGSQYPRGWPNIWKNAGGSSLTIDLGSVRAIGGVQLMFRANDETGYPGTYESECITGTVVQALDSAATVVGRVTVPNNACMQTLAFPWPASSATIDARYMRILPSLTSDGHLNMAKVQVIDSTGADIAPSPASVASPPGPWGSEYIPISGIPVLPLGTDTYLYPRTNINTDSWQIDLGSEKAVSGVVFYGRVEDDSGGSNRSVGVRYQVFDKDMRMLTAGTFPYTGSTGAAGSFCDTAQGQYVSFADISMARTAASASALAAVPRMVHGLSLWLDAADINGNGIQPAENEKIITWTDKSVVGTQKKRKNAVNNNQGQNTSAIYIPTLTGPTVGSIRMSPVNVVGARGGFSLPDNSLSSGSSSFTIFAVFSSATPGAFAGSILSTTNSANATTNGFRAYCEAFAAGNIGIAPYIGTNAIGESASTKATLLGGSGKPILMCLKYDAGTKTIRAYCYGIEYYSFTYTTVNPWNSTNHQIGTGGYMNTNNALVEQAFNGTFYEVIGYNEVALSDSMRNEVEKYLLNKWGMQRYNKSVDMKGVETVFTPKAKPGVPASIGAPLTLWLDASDIDGEGSRTVATTPLTTGMWKDKSGNGALTTVVPGTTITTNPQIVGMTTYGGVNIGVANAAGASLITAGNPAGWAGVTLPNNTLTNGSNSFTTFVVFKSSCPGKFAGSILMAGSVTAGTNSLRVYSEASAPGEIGVIPYTGDNTSIQGEQRTDRKLLPGGTNMPIVMCVKYDATAQIIQSYVYGYTSISYKYPAAQPWGPINNYIGGGMQAFFGTIYEVIGYNTTALSDAQRGSIEMYLGAKWGVQGLINTALTAIVPVPPSITPYGPAPSMPIIKTGLTLWLDGADPNGNGVKPEEGAAVRTWFDKSGSGLQPNSVATGETRLNYKAGNVYSATTSSVEFWPMTGVTGGFALANNTLTTGANSFTIFIVFTSATPGVFANNFLSTSGSKSATTNSIRLYSEWVSGTIGYASYQNGAATDFQMTTPLPGGTAKPVIVTLKYSSITKILQAYVYGNPDFAITYTNSNPWSQANHLIGAGGQEFGTSQFNGKIYEVIGYNNSALPDSQRRSIENYLGSKWGVSAYLRNPNAYSAITTTLTNSIAPYKLQFPLVSVPLVRGRSGEAMRNADGTYTSLSIKARYVRILPNDNGYFGFSKLQVFGNESSDIAPTGTAKVTSLIESNPPTVWGNAGAPINGSPGLLQAGNHYNSPNGDVLMNNGKAGDFWELDLGSVKEINSIVFYGRPDWDDASRIAGTKYQILDGDSVEITSGLFPNRGYEAQIVSFEKLALAAVTAAAGASTSIPAQIEGLSLWLDAADVNGNGSEPIVGTNLVSWKDKSGKGNNLINRVSTIAGGGPAGCKYAPTAVGAAKGAIQLSKGGGNGVMALPANALATGTSSFTFFIVFTSATPGTFGGTIVSNSDRLPTTENAFRIHSERNAANRFGLIPYAAGVILGAAEVQTTTPLPAGTSKPVILCAKYDATTKVMQLYVYGNPDVSYTYTSVNPWANNLFTYIGSGNGNWFNGSMYEVIGYNKVALSDPLRNVVEGYLANKWGVQSYLPANSLYATKGPTFVGYSLKFPLVSPASYVAPAVVPAMQTVAARYVVIMPNSVPRAGGLDVPDGYFSMSKLQVFDKDANDIAPAGSVTAPTAMPDWGPATAPVNGSPGLVRAGRINNKDVGDIYVQAGPVAGDAWTLDLGSVKQIASIVFYGRPDWDDYSRIAGTKYQILDGNKGMVASGTFPQRGSGGQMVDMGPVAQSQRVAAAIPRQVPGLTLWMDAADVNNTGAQPAAGAITGWKDKSPAAVTATAYTGAKITYAATSVGTAIGSVRMTADPISSPGGMVFPSSTLTTNSGANPNSFTVFVVFSSATPGKFAGTIMQADMGANATTNSMRLYSEAAAAGKLGIIPYNGSGAGSNKGEMQATLPAGASTATPILLTIIYDSPSATMKSFVFGKSDVTYTYPAPVKPWSADWHTIGMNSNPSSENFNGSIYEVIGYNRTALGDSQRQLIESYLGWKWGFQTTLVGNPIAAVAPTRALAAILPVPTTTGPAEQALAEHTWAAAVGGASILDKTTIASSAVGTAWTQMIATSNSVTGAAYLNFTVTFGPGLAQVFGGLTETPTNVTPNNFTNITLPFWINQNDPNQSNKIFAGGLDTGYTYATTNKYCIVVTNGTIQWYINHMLVLTKARLSTAPLFAMFCFAHAGVSINNISFGGANSYANMYFNAAYSSAISSPITWTSASGMTGGNATANLTASAATNANAPVGWVNMIASTEKLAAPFYMNFSVVPPPAGGDYSLAVGLTQTPTNAAANNWQNITYNFMLNNRVGNMRVSCLISSGYYITLPESYKVDPTAVYTIIYYGPSLQYYINGVMVASTTILTTNPLSVMCSAMDPNVGITGIRFGSPNSIALPRPQNMLSVASIYGGQQNIDISQLAAARIRLPKNVFLPSQLSGLSLWLDAADLFNSNSVIAQAWLPQGGITVSNWADKSGNGANATAAAGSSIMYVPSITGNQLGSMRFNAPGATGTGGMRLPDATLTNGSNSFTLFVVFKSSTPGKFAGSILMTDAVAASTNSLRVYSEAYGPNKIGIIPFVGTSFAGEPKMQTETALPGGTGGPIVFSLVYDATTNVLQSYVFGKKDVAFTYTTRFPWSTANHIIGGGAVQAFNGTLYEVIGYNTVALADAERQQVEGYLGWKWGVNAALTGGSNTAFVPVKYISPNAAYGRYVRVRPSLAGDGWMSVSQVAVYNTAGSLISQGKAVLNATDYAGGAAASSVVDGTLAARAWPAVWQSATSGGYLDIDLGTMQDIAEVTVYMRSDYGAGKAGEPDRITGTRVQILNTTEGFAIPVVEMVLPSNAVAQTVVPLVVQSSGSTGISAQFVRFRPPLYGGDGYASLGQLVVYGTDGSILSQGKATFATSTVAGTTAAWITNGTLAPGSGTNLWMNGTPNRVTEYIEINLGGVRQIGSISYYAANTGITFDRISGSRIQALMTNGAKDTPVYEIVVPSNKMIQTFYPKWNPVGVSGQYVRVRAPLTAGDGYAVVGQIAVYDMEGKNVALNMPPVPTSSFKTGAGNLVNTAWITNGKLAPSAGLNLWMSGTASRTDYVDINLGSVKQISSIVFYAGSTSATDRTTGLRIQVLMTNGANDPPVSEYVLPNSNSIQSIVPTPMSQLGEVFNVGKGFDYSTDYTYEQAAATCATYGAVVASPAQLAAAQAVGAEWCSAGWLNNATLAFPMASIKAGCSTAPGVQSYVSANGKGTVNCFGVKPAQSGSVTSVWGFNGTLWNSPQAVNATAIVAARSALVNSRAIAVSAAQGGVSGRYVRVRPAPVKGDGFISISQIQVLNQHGTNLAQGKATKASSTLADANGRLHAAPSAVVDGTAAIRSGYDVWTSATGNRGTEFWEVDLGSVQPIAAIQYFGSSSVSLDRSNGLRIQILTTNGANDQPISETLLAANTTARQIALPLPNAQVAEVYLINSTGSNYSMSPAAAQAKCAAYGGTLATFAQLQAAQAAGAHWCSAGWLADKTDGAYYPTQVATPSCGNTMGVVVYPAGSLPNSVAAEQSKTDGTRAPATALANAICYGVKPPKGVTTDVTIGFSGLDLWNSPTTSVAMAASATASSATIMAAANDQNAAAAAGCVQGRFVRVMANSQYDGVLVLTQLQVLNPAGANIATGKNVSGSAQAGWGSVSLAAPIDGTFAPRPYGPTTAFAGPSYTIDLGSVQTIRSVVYMGAAGATPAPSASGASANTLLRNTRVRIQVLDPGMAVVSEQLTETTDPIQTVKFAPVPAPTAPVQCRYVRVIPAQPDATHDGYMVLSQLHVFDENGTNIAAKGTAFGIPVLSSSITAPIDGSIVPRIVSPTTSFTSQGSYWQVDLGAMRTVTSVVYMGVKENNTWSNDEYRNQGVHIELLDILQNIVADVFTPSIEPVQLFQFTPLGAAGLANRQAYLAKATPPPLSPMPFVPTQLGGLSLWLDGADVIGNGTQPATGTNLITWVDKSGKSANATITPIATAAAATVAGQYVRIRAPLTAGDGRAVVGQIAVYDPAGNNLALGIAPVATSSYTTGAGTPVVTSWITNGTLAPSAGLNLWMSGTNSRADHVQINLGSVKQIASITFYAGDTGADRTTGLRVQVLNITGTTETIVSENVLPNASTIQQVIPVAAGTLNTAANTISCRYVRVKASSADGWLSFSQLVVLSPTGVNLAANKTTKAINSAVTFMDTTTPKTYDGSYAVDGSSYLRTFPTVYNATTNDANTSYWEVDLGSVQQVSSITFYGDKDPKVQYRIPGIRIQCLNTNEANPRPVCEMVLPTNAYIQTLIPKATIVQYAPITTPLATGGVSFTGAQAANGMVLPDRTLTSGTNPFTLFAVFSSATPGKFAGWPLWGGSVADTTSNCIGFYSEAYGPGKLGILSRLAETQTTSALSAATMAQPIILTLSYNPTTRVLSSSVYGSPDVTQTYASNLPWSATSHMIGNNVGFTSVQPFNGKIYEVIGFNSTGLAPAQIQTVEAYLAAKWGVQAALPASHLYKTPYVPTTLPSTTLWLDAADITGLGVQPSPTSPVTLWKDKSGKRANATAANVVSGRYIRVRPSIALGDGHVEVSQIAVYGLDGTTNLAASKAVSATSAFTGTVSTSITDGTLTPRPAPTLWISNGSRSDYATIDLGSSQPITMIVFYGRSDCCNTTGASGNGDRITGTRIEVLTAPESNAVPVAECVLQSANQVQTLMPSAATTPTGFASPVWYRFGPNALNFQSSNSVTTGQTSSGMKLPNGTLTTGQKSFTLCMVFSSSSPGTFAGWPVFAGLASDVASNSVGVCVEKAATRLSVYSQNGPSGVLETPTKVLPAASSTPILLTLMFDASTQSLYSYVYGIADVTQKYTTNNPWSTVSQMIGNNIGLNGQAFNGNIHEIAGFNSTALIVPQRQAVEGYLAWKWGIAQYLSPGHLYAAYPPSAALYTQAVQAALTQQTAISQTAFNSQQVYGRYVRVRPAAANGDGTHGHFPGGSL
jgi:hypothetical protein